jgi:hypothetical protein
MARFFRQYVFGEGGLREQDVGVEGPWWRCRGLARYRRCRPARGHLQSAMPALGTKCGSAQVSTWNGPTSNRCPAVNSCSVLALASMRGLSSARTAFTAPGSACTGSVAGRVPLEYSIERLTCHCYQRA